MCGICGLLSLDGGYVDPEVLAEMNATLVHRGPDSAGQLVEHPVGLAMRRLSIIDLAGGDQPISNEDGTVSVVQNGEIYNYRELRKQLERAGHRFSTNSDTEVLVHLYEDHGPSFAERLRGMFAIAVWDAPRRELVLARDRFGIKPLYYRIAGGLLSFASELKALLRQPGFSRDIDLDAVEAFLAMNCVPAPLTIFREARKLPPGHLLVCRDGEIGVRPFARPRPVASSGLRTAGEDELAEELRELLRDSVRAHLVADVPVGILLSGGVDSAGLTALAALESSERLSTFSIGFEERSFNELDQARLVAERYDTDHHELVVRPNAVELLPALVDAFDEPFADPSALPTYLVAELAAGKVKVAFAGEGADELLGGYHAYVADLLAPRVGGAARALRPLIDMLPTSRAGRSFEGRLKRFARDSHLPAAERHQAWTAFFSADARAELWRPDRDRGVDPLALYRARYAETEGAEPLARLQDLDVGLSLVDDLLVKSDRAAMAHSLEVRVPFLDVAVADFAMALPSKLKVRGWSKKRLLRRALAPLLPAEIIGGRKRGFSIPMAAWLRGELQPLAREILSPETVRSQCFFRPEVVTRLLDDHVARREDLSRELWGLMCFSLWFERHARAPSS